MKNLILIAITSVLPYVAQASNCYGSSSYYTCNDNSGNRYDISRYGSYTQVDGYNYNTGSSWSQSTQNIGNTSYTNGYDKNGNSWNSTSQTIGNITYQNGTDSRGRQWNQTIQKIGDYTYYSGTDGNGNSYNKACNQYGCF